MAQTEKGGRDRRRARRYAVNQPGTLRYAAGSVDCTVMNVSAGGALVEAGATVALQSEVNLIVPQWGRFAATVVRVARESLGLMFTADLPGTTQVPDPAPG